VNPDKKATSLANAGELFIFATILRKEYLMLLKTLVTAIIEDIIFLLFVKLPTWKKTDTNHVIHSFYFSIIFFIILLVTKTFT